MQTTIPKFMAQVKARFHSGQEQEETDRVSSQSKQFAALPLSNSHQMQHAQQSRQNSTTTHTHTHNQQKERVNQKKPIQSQQQNYRPVAHHPPQSVPAQKSTFHNDQQSSTKAANQQEEHLSTLHQYLTKEQIAQLMNARQQEGTTNTIQQNRSQHERLVQQTSEQQTANKQISSQSLLKDRQQQQSQSQSQSYQHLIAEQQNGKLRHFEQTSDHEHATTTHINSGVQNSQKTIHLSKSKQSQEKTQKVKLQKQSQNYIQATTQGAGSTFKTNQERSEFLNQNLGVSQRAPLDQPQQFVQQFYSQPAAHQNFPAQQTPDTFEAAAQQSQTNPIPGKQFLNSQNHPASEAITVFPAQSVQKPQFTQNSRQIQRQTPKSRAESSSSRQQYGMMQVIADEGDFGHLATSLKSAPIINQQPPVRQARHKTSAAYKNKDGQNSNHNSRSRQGGVHPQQASGASLNMISRAHQHPPYLAKGGVQTPPAGFHQKNGRSSVGSRRVSCESSGMLSMGSVGAGSVLDGALFQVQKPLVREFKTQGKLNNTQEGGRGMSGGPGAIIEKTPAACLGGKISMKNSTLIGNINQASQRKLMKKTASKIAESQRNQPLRNNTNASSKSHLAAGIKTSATAGIQEKVKKLADQKVQNAANNQGNQSKIQTMQGGKRGINSVVNRQDIPNSSQNIAPTVLKQNKQKSLSQSYQQQNLTAIQASIANINVQQRLSVGVSPQVLPPNSQIPQTENTIDLKVRPGTKTQQVPSPVAINDHSEPPSAALPSNLVHLDDTNTLSAGHTHHPQQQVALPSQSNQNETEAIERNEELMSLLACLNEQAIKELNSQDDSELEKGFQRLLKAYKIMVETKNPNSFDASYKAIVCYNLACYCQMQTELANCAKYLTKAIEFVSFQLEKLKKSAVCHYNEQVQKQAQSNNTFMSNTLLDQQSLSMTASSISTIKKPVNSANEEKKKKDFGSVSAQKRQQTSELAKRGIIQNQSKVGTRARHDSGLGASSRQFNVYSNQNLKVQIKRPVGFSQNAASNLPYKGLQAKTREKGLKNSRTDLKGGVESASRSKAQGENFTTGSLYSEFSRFANNTTRSKVSQKQLRTNSMTQGKQTGTASNPIGNAQKERRQTGGAIAASQSSQKNLEKLFGSVTLDKNGNQVVKNGVQQVLPNRLQSSKYGQVAKRLELQQELQPTAAATQETVSQSKITQKAKATLTVKQWLYCFQKESLNSKLRPKREVLEKAIHLTRFYCRFVLQLCAVLSQLNEHEQALQLAKNSSMLASELIEMTLILIKDELKPGVKANDSQGFGDDSLIQDKSKSKSKRRRKHSTSNQLDPYSTLSKQKTQTSARGNNLNSSSQSKSLLKNQGDNNKIAQSYTVSNFHSSTHNLKDGVSASDLVKSGALLTTSNQMNQSNFNLSYFPSQVNEEKLQIERESLERIHTFSLKEPVDQNQSDDGPATGGTVTLFDQFNGASTERHQRNDQVGSNSQHNLNNISQRDATIFGTGSTNRQRGISQGSRNSSTTSQRSCSHYVPEKVQIFTKQIRQTSEIVSELQRIQKEFFQISELNFVERRDYFQNRMAEKKKLKISFQTYEEVSKLQMEQKYKIKDRSALGLKNFATDDWIFSFNIGNIMHLQTLGFDELTNAKTIAGMVKKGTDSLSQPTLDSIHLKISQSKGSEKFATVQQAMKSYLQQETSKDQLLHKTLFVIVSFFCIGTELRFLATLNPTKYSIKDSEIWHAKAIHIASYFLPNDCPLIQHITQSYQKHHLKPKIKRMQDKLAQMAKMSP